MVDSGSRDGRPMIYAVGDIHGHCAKLADLLSRLARAGMTDDDVLVFVGDYIDRGPATAGVLNLLIELKERRPNTIFLRGNHEQMMLDARQRFDPGFDPANSCGNSESGKYWFTEGATETLRSYEKGGTPTHRERWFQMAPQAHWDFLLATRLEYRQDGYIFVHAGIVPPGVVWAEGEFKSDPRLWIRYEFIASESDFGGQTVVFGHTPTRDGRPLILKNKVAIDTGAGYGGPLTAVGLPVPYDPGGVLVLQSI